MYLGFTRACWKDPNKSVKKIKPNIDWGGQEQFETQASIMAEVETLKVACPRVPKKMEQQSQSEDNPPFPRNLGNSFKE